jgi:single-strand DNA-binding protein
MPGFNKVILMRTLTRGPEVRHIPSGASVCRFALAINRSYTTQAGHRRNETCFLAMNVWGRQVERCGQYLKKGHAALVEGRLQTQRRQTADGQKRSVVEVVAERVQFLGSPNGNQEDTPRVGAADPSPAPDRRDEPAA